MKEYLDMWNWESECWGEKNVANFHQLEEELVGQCLQTPVDGSLDTRSMPAMKTAASMVQPHVASYLRPAATYPFMQVRAVNLYSVLGDFSQCPDKACTRAYGLLLVESA